MTALQLVWYLNIAVTVALIGRLALSGLISRYRWLFLYLLADTLQQLIRAPLQSNMRRSAEVYMAGQAVKTVLSVFVVLELYRLALVAHPALARWGRNTVVYVLLAAACIAGLELVANPSAPPQVVSTVLYDFYWFERAMDVWVLIFLLLISLFITWFPVRLKRNVALYIGGFVFYFLVRFVYLLLLMSVLDPRASQQRFFDELNLAVLWGTFACLLVWVAALRPEGEQATTVLGHSWDRSSMLRLTSQLDAINATLGRFSRHIKTR